MPHQIGEFDENDPRWSIHVLSLRVDQLVTKIEEDKRRYEKELTEKEEEIEKLEERVASMERTFQRGAGIMLVLPIVGAAIGILMAYGKIIFAPWTGAK